RVRSLDAAYYEASFARDPVISGCRQGVSSTPSQAGALAVTEPPEPRPRPGSGGLRVGGYMLGIGVITFGVSLALVSSADVFLIGMTVGALLFAIGLIVLLISAIIMAAN